MQIYVHIHICIYICICTHAYIYLHNSCMRACATVQQLPCHGSHWELILSLARTSCRLGARFLVSSGIRRHTRILRPTQISSRVATSPDLDLTFGAVDENVDRACTSLLSPLSHLPPPTSSPPSSAAAGEPI